ncbi:RagB/SusD family nutrient uptake outer membrane protein [Chitinophaga caeni]|uniref:RagB/SusD family nutrient uptake outer membrane protein n=1 Tax=Chitinophaga caeni TaxID=2029983 RepID=A0A291QXW1_9BACT|nr:RagB/SusD family nutrient uptake outer membrane protein [Chitinophaga caeni]ATL48703.1 RagB/SusD family nutrient uptake outer membrane protein [Chitinophaga caeni]
MKKKIALYIICGLTVMAACKKSDSFLDKRQTESLNEQVVFSDSAKTLQFLNDVYAYTGMDVYYFRYSYIKSPVGNDYSCMEDKTSHSISFYSEPQASLMTGASTARNYFTNNYWSTYYSKIRACNQYMKKVQGAPLSSEMKVRTAAEARYLRAFYYAQLVRSFGAVMLVGDTVFSELATPIEYKRNTFKECIDYIAQECDAVAQYLPSATEQLPQDYGRITSGMCYGLKARMLVYAASPLFNGGAITDDPELQPLVSYGSNYDPQLWQRAANACKDVMNLGDYHLYTNDLPGARDGYSFWKLFLTRKNVEYIQPFMIGNNTNLEGAWFPISRGGSGWSTPTQNLVDAFGMRNGKRISDPASGYDPEHPYDNRDPRFYNSIIFNQARIYNNSTKKMDPINIYRTWQGQLTPDGLQTYKTKTGYYSRKMCNDSTGDYSSQSRVYPVIRYAEIILGYAEAMNELNGPTAEVYDMLYQIRERAGVDPGVDGRYGLSATLSKEDMRSIIRNEYEVEFAYEGHWYYDTRRWKTAEVTENIPMQGMMVTKEQDDSWSYEKITAMSAVFLAPKMYFAPIPFNEITKSAVLYQNPGW